MSEGPLSPVTIGVRLFLICTAAALGLGVINEITEPRIVARRIADRRQVIASFVEKGRTGDPVAGKGGVEVYYPVLDGETVSGYVLALNGTGYGGVLRLLAYYEIDGAVRIAKLVENLETPGLGKKAETAEYMAMFAGTGGDRPVPVTKEMLGATSAGSRSSSGSGAGRIAWARASRAGLGGWLLGASGGGGGPADAVTGATITFKGVAGALAEGSRFAKSLGGGK